MEDACRDRESLPGEELDAAVLEVDDQPPIDNEGERNPNATFRSIV